MREKLKRICSVIELYLSDIFGRIRVYREENNFLIPWGFTVINISVFEEGDDVILDINSPVALNVKPSKDLMKFLLSENANLKSSAFFTEFEKGFMDIILGIKVRYRDISKEFLKFLVLNIGNLANEYGKEIIAVFGGLSFKEFLEREKANLPFYGEKLFYEKLEVNGHKLLLEVFTDGESYTFICREEGKSEPIIKSKKGNKEPYDMLKLLENVKEILKKGQFNKLRTLFTPFEVDFFKLYKIFIKASEDRKLKELEQEINRLPEMLINGKITYEEYKKRIQRIEREIGLT